MRELLIRASIDEEMIDVVFEDPRQLAEYIITEWNTACEDVGEGPLLTLQFATYRETKR